MWRLIRGMKGRRSRGGERWSEGGVLGGLIGRWRYVYTCDMQEEGTGAVGSKCLCHYFIYEKAKANVYAISRSNRTPKPPSPATPTTKAPILMMIARKMAKMIAKLAMMIPLAPMD